MLCQASETRFPETSPVCTDCHNLSRRVSTTFSREARFHSNRSGFGHPAAPRPQLPHGNARSSACCCCSSRTQATTSVGYGIVPRVTWENLMCCECFLQRHLWSKTSPLHPMQSALASEFSEQSATTCLALQVERFGGPRSTPLRSRRCHVLLATVRESPFHSICLNSTFTRCCSRKPRRTRVKLLGTHTKLRPRWSWSCVEQHHKGVPMRYGSSLNPVLFC